MAAVVFLLLYACSSILAQEKEFQSTICSGENPEAFELENDGENCFFEVPKHKSQPQMWKLDESAPPGTTEHVWSFSFPAAKSVCTSYQAVLLPMEVDEDPRSKAAQKLLERLQDKNSFPLDCSLDFKLEKNESKLTFDCRERLSNEATRILFYNAVSKGYEEFEIDVYHEESSKNETTVICYDEGKKQDIETPTTTNTATNSVARSLVLQLVVIHLTVN